MMPVLRINDATFADLKSISTWLGTNTPSETIDRIVRDTMQTLGMERDDEPNSSTSATSGTSTEFDEAPGLAFTKTLSASVNGQRLQRPTWAAILVTMIAQVKAKGFEGSELARELNIPAKVEKYEDEGFRYHPHLGISIQGQSASDAWKEINRLAKKWHIPVIVEFQWRPDPKAQFPGRTGVLRA